MSNYTEEPTPNKGGLFGVIHFILNVFLGPRRLLGEISRRVIFLKRNAVEQLLMVTALILLGLLVVDVVIYLTTGTINFTGGFSPVLSKMLALLMCGVCGWYINRIDMPYTEDDEVEGGEVGEDFPASEDVAQVEEEELEDVAVVASSKIEEPVSGYTPPKIAEPLASPSDQRVADLLAELEKAPTTTIATVPTVSMHDLANELSGFGVVAPPVPAKLEIEDLAEPPISRRSNPNDPKPVRIEDIDLYEDLLSFGSSNDESSLSYFLNDDKVYAQALLDTSVGLDLDSVEQLNKNNKLEDLFI